VAELEAGDATTLLTLTSGKVPLHPTPDSALAGLTGLTAQGMALAETALRLAMVGQQSDKMFEAILTRLEADRAAVVSGAGRVDDFEAAILDATLTLPDQPARVGFAAGYLRQRTGAPTRAALMGMLQRPSSGETLVRLETLAGMLGDRPLRQVFARVGGC
jgi:hypothetical protein